MSIAKKTADQAKPQETSLFLPKSVLRKTKALLSKRNFECSANLNTLHRLQHPNKDESLETEALNEEEKILKQKPKEIASQLENSSSFKFNSHKLEKVLAREFYTIDAVTLARNLLGKIIVRKVEKQVIKCRIVETEAYCGIEDKGCHAYGDKFTDRTKHFYDEGGYLYVNLIYGLFYCASITADVQGEAAEVLIRAVEVLEGINHVVFNREMKNPSTFGKELVNGPGKVCAALRIYQSHSAHDVTRGDEIYIIEGDGRPFETVVSKRINIDFAEEYKDKPWRFYIKDNIYVSCKGAIVEVITPIDFPEPIENQHSPRTASFLESLDRFKAPSRK